MASQARLQQLTGSMSGMLSAEGQLQLQRAVQQLQQELSAVSKERNEAAEQLYHMVRQADAAASALQEAEKLKQHQAELQHKVVLACCTSVCGCTACMLYFSLRVHSLHASGMCRLSVCSLHHNAGKGSIAFICFSGLLVLLSILPTLLNHCSLPAFVMFLPVCFDTA
jgi:hypothetical protein